MQRYLSYYNGNQAKAIEAYDENIRLAQSLVPLLNVFEVALRNAVHNLLTKKFARQDWWQALHGQEFVDLLAAIRAAQYKLERTKDKAYPDKIVAVHHESLLWLKPDVGATYKRGLGTLAWIDPRLVDCLARYGDVCARWPLNSRIRPPRGVGQGLVSLIQP